MMKAVGVSVWLIRPRSQFIFSCRPCGMEIYVGPFAKKQIPNCRAATMIWYALMGWFSNLIYFCNVQPCDGVSATQIGENSHPAQSLPGGIRSGKQSSHIANQKFWTYQHDWFEVCSQTWCNVYRSARSIQHKACLVQDRSESEISCG